MQANDIGGHNTFSAAWKWAAWMYCILVLFHLFPSFLLQEMWLEQLWFHDGPMELWKSAPVNFRLWGLGGILAVAWYAAWRSGERPVAASMLAAFLYTVTLVLGVRIIPAIHAGELRSWESILWLLLTLMGTAGGVLLGAAMSPRLNRSSSENR